LVLHARFDRVASLDARIAGLGVDHVRVLVLAGVMPERRISRDGLAVESRGVRFGFWSAGNAVESHHTRSTVELPFLEIGAFHPGQSQAQIQYGFGVQSPRGTECDRTVVAAEQVAAAA